MIKSLKKFWLKDVLSNFKLFLERVSEVLSAIQKKLNFSHIVSAASSFSRDVIPRTAAKFDVSPISDVTSIHDESTFTRPTYAGNAMSKVNLI